MQAKDKCDLELGLAVREHLVAMGVETPMRDGAGGDMNDAEKIEAIKGNVRAIMDILNLDLEDPSLRDTPRRVAKMYVNEIFSGLNYENFPKCTSTPKETEDDGMVLVKNIDLQSSCEHHLISITGFANIAYIPKDRVIGLSKLNRLVRFFAQRPQIQERLTLQIFYALQYVLGTNDIAVYIDAEHLCVKQRGVRDTQSSTTTTKLGGIFMTDSSLRSEFYAAAHR